METPLQIQAVLLCRGIDPPVEGRGESINHVVAALGVGDVPTWVEVKAYVRIVGPPGDYPVDLRPIYPDGHTGDALSRSVHIGGIGHGAVLDVDLRFEVEVAGLYHWRVSVGDVTADAPLMIFPRPPAPVH